MKTGYKVSDLMTANPIKVGTDSTIQDCASLMSTHKIGSLLVMKGSKLAGIITEEDIITKAVIKDVLPSSLKVKDLMTDLKHVISIEPNKDVYDALVLMREMEFRRLPVINKGNLVGLITIKDIINIQPDLFDVISEKAELSADKKIFQLFD